ncbi:cyclic pyranopterin monophosphate synthase MoaC [candidate division KSB1 bacterium]
MKNLSHFDKNSRAKMVDITEKRVTVREALAQAEIYIKEETLEKILENKIAKGDTLNIAKTAGIMASKNTPSLIPLCHPLMITNIDIDFEINKGKSCITIKSNVKSEGKTGVEMEALCAVMISALTIYDMCKAEDKNITISNICLLKKSGGKSGNFIRGSK